MSRNSFQKFCELWNSSQFDFFSEPMKGGGDSSFNRRGISLKIRPIWLGLTSQGHYLLAVTYSRALSHIISQVGPILNVHITPECCEDSKNQCIWNILFQSKYPVYKYYCLSSYEICSRNPLYDNYVYFLKMNQNECQRDKVVVGKMFLVPQIGLGTSGVIPNKETGVRSENFWCVFKQ